MSTNISKEIYSLKLKQCQKGKHKLRINQYGVTWCTICGLLSNTNNAELLKEEDKLNII